MDDALGHDRPMSIPETSPVELETGAHGVTLADGRVLEVLEGGDPHGFPLLYHGGQPSAAVHHPLLDDAARGAGLRLITYSRPGYGASSARARGTRGPRVVDDVDDVVALLDHVGVDEFITLGWSGGGPRALACAALLPGRCRAATSLAGAAPRDADGLDWSAGMAAENVAEYAAAVAGPQTYAEHLTADFLPALEAGPDELAEAMGGLMPPVDRAALDDETAAMLTRTFHRAGAQGVRGVRDDGLAVVAPWGLDLSAITVPTAVWQGEEDAMVPLAHGRWLAEHVPGARVHLVEGEGHVSLLRRLPEMLAELRDMAALPPA